jgi:putative transposase
MITRRPSRLRAFSYTGFHQYSLTFCTHHRQRHFIDGRVVSLTLTQFLRAAEEQQFAVLVYCFMPDHAHLLVEGLAETSDGKRFIKLGKQYSGYAFSREFGARLWQPWGFERVLRAEEDTHVVCRYILQNPVRAGLVGRVLDYPYLGSAVHRVEDLLDGLPQPRNEGGL